MDSIYIVGCGASKLDRSAPARDLYTGSLFVAARRHVESLRVRWLVLSARYGIVEPDWELEPYEQKLAKRGADLAAWALSAASSAVSRTAAWADRERGIPGPPNPRRFVFLCGVEYARPVSSVLQSWDWETMQPLEGMQLGERLSWFKKQRAMRR